MKNLLLAVSLLITAGSALAVNNPSYMKCNGTDTTGQSMYLITYPNSSVVNINGDMLNIVGKTNNEQGVVTQKFLSVNGVLVYDSIVPINNTSLTIYQFNAVTQALLAQAWLTCQFYGYSVSAPSVMDHQIFNSIKAKSLRSIDEMPYNKFKEKISETLNSPVDSCIAKVDSFINSAKNKLSSAGLLCSSTGINMIMTLAMSKGKCYGVIDHAKLCQIEVDAMVSSGGGCGFSDTYLRNTAKQISGC